MKAITLAVLFLSLRMLLHGRTLVRVAPHPCETTPNRTTVGEIASNDSVIDTAKQCCIATVEGPVALRPCDRRLGLEPGRYPPFFVSARAWYPRACGMSSFSGRHLTILTRGSQSGLRI